MGVLLVACSSSGDAADIVEPSIDTGVGEDDAGIGEDDASAAPDEGTSDPKDAANKPDRGADSKETSTPDVIAQPDVKLKDQQLDLEVGKETAAGFDLTFFVASDLHFNEALFREYHVRAMNQVSADNGDAATWPTEIDGKPTSFGGAGKRIQDPLGVVITGDITSNGGGILPIGEGDQLSSFRALYEMDGEGSSDRLRFPIYVGLGNHDVDPDGIYPDSEVYRRRMWGYVDQMHKGSEARVPVGSFDPASRNYSWTWGGAHFVHTQRFPGDETKGQINSLSWIADDLGKNASDGRPVFIFQHYGYDSWSADEWWSDQERADFKQVISGFNVVGLFAGHAHAAMNLTWEGYSVFQANNAAAENGFGNDDGNGSFIIIHVTNEYMDMVTCRWTDGQGAVELIAPYYSRKF